MCRIYRLLVRGLLVVIVCAFSFALLLAERPEMLLGGTMLEQSASHGQAINPDLAEASSILDQRVRYCGRRTKRTHEQTAVCFGNTRACEENDKRAYNQRGEDSEKRDKKLK